MLQVGSRVKTGKGRLSQGQPRVGAGARGDGVTVDTDPDWEGGETGVFMMLRVKIPSYLSEYAVSSRERINLKATHSLQQPKTIHTYIVLKLIISFPYGNNVIYGIALVSCSTPCVFYRDESSSSISSRLLKPPFFIENL